MKGLKIIFIASLILLSTASMAAENSAFLGASLYISPLPENPRSGSNFTATVRVDSLTQPINAVSGRLLFNPDKLEVINVSRIGSIFNIWLEEPNYSNLEGRLSFQGGLPASFIGNGGSILHIIFKAKAPGVTSLIWDRAEVLAHDGNGTNILTNLQNHDFSIDKEIIQNPLPEEKPFYENPLVLLNIGLLIILGLLGVRHFINSILKEHDREHETKFNENEKV